LASGNGVLFIAPSAAVKLASLCAYNEKVV